MGSSKKTFISLFLILITSFIVINQFRLADQNKELNSRIITLNEKTETIINSNSDLVVYDDGLGKLFEDLPEGLNNSVLETIEESVVPDKAVASSREIIVDENFKKIIEDKIKTEEEIKEETTDKIIEEIVAPPPVESLRVDDPDQPNKENINILLIGVNSGLTDTIMVLSINRDKKLINTISIPRDFWDAKTGEKVNRIYRRHGFEVFKDSIERILNLRIDKTIKLYFEGFEKIIDHLGGIWIYNKVDILDNRYPSKDYKYETFELSKGYHKLDGNYALKFARTRHGDTDFKRAERQQEVINGVFNRVKELDFSDINAILNITREVIKYVDTDIGVFDAFEYVSDYKDFEIRTGNVLQVPTHLYSDRNYLGEYVVLPRDPTFTHIHDYVAKIVN